MGKRIGSFAGSLNAPSRRTATSAAVLAALVTACGGNETFKTGTAPSAQAGKNHHHRRHRPQPPRAR
jgi:hypothetical protein